MALDVLNVVELGSNGVVHVNDNDLPVSLLLVEQSHDAENLDLLDLSGVSDKLADLANVERVIVTLGFGLRVGDVGVFPGLVKNKSATEYGVMSHSPASSTYLGEGTIIPQISLVGEAVTNISQLSLLDVLLDGVEELLLADLMARKTLANSFSPVQRLSKKAVNGAMRRE